MHVTEESAAPAEPQRAGPTRRVWTRAWAVLPVRALVFSVIATAAVWGRFLLPAVTLSTEAQGPAVAPMCRAATDRLACVAPLVETQCSDPAAAALQEIPADHFFRRARERGEPRPSWNAYVGSGSPVALDGINAGTSPTRWFLSKVPGDRGRDAVVFCRFFLWTFGIVWAVGLAGAGAPLLAAVAAVAALAPYPASFVDIIYLDVDLLGPWGLVLLLAFVTGRLSLRAAAGLSLALGLLVGAMGFVQAQLVLAVAVGILALAAAPATRGRSLAIAAGFGAGVLAFLPASVPLLRNLDQFVTSRQAVCVIEQGTGAAELWSTLLRPPAAQYAVWAATATLVGAGLLAFLPRRWWFVLVTLAISGVWLVLGAPHAACALPVVSGLRFMRHLVPFFEALFVFAVATAAHAISERIDRRWTWAVLAAAGAAAVAIAAGGEPALRPRMIGCAILGTALGAMGVVVRSSSAIRVSTRRGLFAAGLVLLAFQPYFFWTRISYLLWEGKAGAPEIAPLPLELDPATPLGAVRRLSETEDRRHFSPGGFLFPNWPEAVGVLDVVSIGAFYPVGYHELNAGLFPYWATDAQHGIVPDRFLPPGAPWMARPELQRMLAVNRVSLLTFVLGQARFAPAPSPYEASRCRLLARSAAQASESYLCPDVGGVGYFPEMVRVVGSRAEALSILKLLSPSDITRTALLGPELDASGPGPAPAVPEVGAGRVVSVDRRGDDLTYVLEVERAGTFVVADTYFRGWKATVNGAPAGISRANVGFKAVRVPQGRVVLALHFRTVL